MKNFKFLSGFIVMLALLFASCEKIEVNSPKNEIPNENFIRLSANDIDIKDIKVENGYLTFHNLDHFKKVLEDVQRLQSSELKKLEGRFGFVSKRSIIDQALAEFSTLTQENYATEASRFKDVFEFDQEGKFIGLDFPLYNRASLLNADGIVKVGKELYIYMNDKFVSIADGDYSKVEYAKKLDNPDPEKGIWVGKITTTKSNPDMFRGTVTLHHCTSSFPPPPFYRVYTFDGKLTTVDMGPGPILGCNFFDFDFFVEGISVKIIWFQSPNPQETFTFYPLRGAVRLFACSESSSEFNKSFNYPPITFYDQWFIQFSYASGTHLGSSGGVSGTSSHNSGLNSSSDGVVCSLNGSVSF